MKQFRTGSNRLVSGHELSQALKMVADDWRKLADDIRKEDHYAAHVSEEEKDRYCAEMRAAADAIQAGEVNSFAIWQRVNFILTGESVAFLPK